MWRINGVVLMMVLSATSVYAAGTNTPAASESITTNGFLLIGEGFVKPGVGDQGFSAYGGTPAITYYETDAAVDEKSWYSGPSNGDFYYRTQTDTGVSSVIYQQFSRTGNLVMERVLFANDALQSSNGARWIHGQSSELLTLSTSGTTTNTSANLLPSNSIIEAVVARVTTTIGTATDWRLGDSTTAGRFTAANTNLTAGTTDVGLVHVDVAGAAGPRQTSAATVRVTTTGIPSAGAIRITVFYRQFIAPTN